MGIFSSVLSGTPVLSSIRIDFHTTFFRTFVHVDLHFASTLDRNRTSKSMEYFLGDSTCLAGALFQQEDFVGAKEEWPGNRGGMEMGMETGSKYSNSPSIIMAVRYHHCLYSVFLRPSHSKWSREYRNTFPIYRRLFHLLQVDLCGGALSVKCHSCVMMEANYELPYFESGELTPTS
jgi:hypothetical protein